MNQSLSKSEVKALGCEYYYRKYYVDHVPQHEMSWTRVGTQFHRFMDAYVAHLVATNQQSDMDYVARFIESGVVCDEASLLISSYAAGFILEDPSSVIGTETFYVIGDDWKPIRNVEYPGVGKRPVVPGAFAHGTVDLTERTGPTSIRIRDYKSGFMPSRVDPYEAIHYALLVFCHFPDCQTVEFVWDFVRFRSTQSATYGRDELPELQGQLCRRVAERNALASKADPPQTNGLSGLCGYCALDCPLRQAAADGHTIFRPIQNDEDAKAAAATLGAFRSAKGTLEAQLRAYLINRGAVEIDGDKVARLKTSHTPQFQLRTVLAALGITVPEKSPEYDVPLDKLIINGTELKSYGRAKKREGFLETVQASVPTKPRTSLCIGEMEEGE